MEKLREVFSASWFYLSPLFNTLMLTHLLSGILMLAIPLGLALFLQRRFKAGWRIWWIGALTFITSQAGHIPFNVGANLLFERGWLPAPPERWALVFSAAFLGLSAGMWESWFRWIAYRWWAKDARTWRSGVMLGAGHGGMEAILIGLLSLYTLLNIWVLKDRNLAELLPPDQIPLAQQQLAAYAAQPWYLPLLGTAERIFALVFHIAASLLVLQAFTRRQILWVWLAVGWHALMDGFFAVYLPVTWQDYPWRWVAIEAALGALAVTNLGIILRLRQPEPVGAEETTPAPLPPPSLTDVLTRMDETATDLDETRFSE